MAADGEDMTNPDASDFVQEVTPFPLAQDIFLLSKPSLPAESALSDTNKPKQDEGSTLAPEHPFQPFLQGSIANGVEVEEGSHHLATNDDVDGSGSVLPPEHSLSEDFNSGSAGLGDVSEKRVGEKIALFEGLFVQQGDDHEEHVLGKTESLNSQDGESKTVLGAELSDVLINGAVPGTSEVHGLTVEEERVTVDSAVSSSGEDVLFEGLTLVDPPSEAPARGTASLGLGDVSTVGGLEEVIAESGGVTVEVESLAIRESLNETSKESEASQSSHTDITLTNGTYKVETLGEILSRDHKAKVSREVGKGTGEETSSSQIISSDHARIASASKAYQGNGDSVPPRALKLASAASSDGYVVIVLMGFLFLLIN